MKQLIMHKTFCRDVVLLLILSLFFSCGEQGGATPDAGFFAKAVPVWPEGLQYEKNITVGFLTQFDQPVSGEATLRIAGASLYRIYLNGTFVGHGPARAGHGYYRVDNWKLSEHLQNGVNHLAIEVASYNVNSYYLLDQPGFLQAEVVAGDEVLAATTSGTDFTAYPLEGRQQKAPRYSFQRPFVEYYRLEPGYDTWRIGEEPPVEPLTCVRVAPKELIVRGVGYPDFVVRALLAQVVSGEVATGIQQDNYWKDRAVVNIGEKLGGFPEAELDYNPSIELQEMENRTLRADLQVHDGRQGFDLEPQRFRIFDLGTNLTGFIGAELEVTQPGRFFLTFDEILTENDVDFKRLGCINAVTYDLSPGRYTLESFEPYTLRYLKVIAADGAAKINNLYLREYANPDVTRATFESNDERLNRIFRAGVETFRQNAVDVFMDCPSRERAGWLCDSYFAARVAQDVSGHAQIERNFFENYQLPDTFAYLPDGMLPMCYPADHNDGVFIPNWSMWFVVQLREYLARTGDRKLVDDLESKVLKLLDYFEPFENESGLLEKLESWIFVEWSAANRFVQDVNYPTNMLYAATLETAGELYGRAELRNKADSIRDTIRRQSFNGQFFVDNAIRNEQGQLEITDNTTEVCQYFAFYFGVATPDSHPDLWQKLTTQFGPRRKRKDPYPQVHFANTFVGDYLRLELLSRYGLQSQLLAESIDYFDYMAQRTGTLWENQSPHASCNHGFASHIVHVLYRDVLGVRNIDFAQKKITIQFSDLDLSSCSGQLPIAGELLQLRWKQEGDRLLYQLEAPGDFEVVIRNGTGLNLVATDQF